jgi:hypothetical protein
MSAPMAPDEVTLRDWRRPDESKSKPRFHREVVLLETQRNAIAATVSAARVIATVHIDLSLPCGEQKRHNFNHAARFIVNVN